MLSKFYVEEARRIKYVKLCPVLMRLGETPVPIPNTTVKT